MVPQPIQAHWRTAQFALTLHVCLSVDVGTIEPCKVIAITSIDRLGMTREHRLPENPSIAVDLITPIPQ